MKNHKKNQFFIAVFLVLLASCSSDKKETTSEIVEYPEEFVLDESDFDSIGLQFTAFKTDKKIGVPGTFKAIFLKANAGKTIAEVMEGAQFTIDAKTVDTALEERNIKVRDYFFGNLTNPYITGTFQSFSTTGYEIVLKMNDIEKTYKINSPASSDSLSFSFPIDVISDFSASKSLEGIAKACEVLHEGKTWSEVEIKGLVRL